MSRGKNFIYLIVVVKLLKYLFFIEMQDGENLCLTKDCIANSNLLFENMNEKADPCDDFYEFACGG